MTRENDDQIRLYLTETGKDTDKYYLTVEYVASPSVNVTPICPKPAILRLYGCIGVSLCQCISVSVYFYYCGAAYQKTGSDKEKYRSSKTQFTPSVSCHRIRGLTLSSSIGRRWFWAKSRLIRYFTERIR